MRALIGPYKALKGPDKALKDGLIGFGPGFFFRAPFQAKRLCKLSALYETLKGLIRPLMALTGPCKALNAL